VAEEWARERCERSVGTVLLSMAMLRRAREEFERRCFERGINPRRFWRDLAFALKEGLVSDEEAASLIMERMELEGLERELRGAVYAFGRFCRPFTIRPR